ncbi:DNA-packaging protein [Enterobacter asburiae]|nr:DNA-packaging protein [Enterobacter asburiae]
MTEKETLIARLKELGVKLDREVNVTGTIQELTLRISELEEELDEEGEEGAEVSVASITAGSTSGQPGPENTSGSISNEPGELVAVETLVTLHIDALHATRNESLSIVEPGVVIRVTDAEATELISQGLAREV